MERDLSIDWPGLLSERIEQSGLSVERFARDVLRRDARTVFRWLAGQSPIPREVQRFLQDPAPAPWPDRHEEGKK